MKKSESINLVADVLAPLAVVIVTVALFFVFQPEEPGTLFWANMIYLPFLEIILFAYIFWLPTRSNSLALKWMCGIYSVIYICVALVWMLLFSVLLCYWLPVKVYFAFIAVITVLWILVGALSLKADNAHQTSVEVLEENRRRVDGVNNNAEMYLQQFNLLLIAHPELNGVAPQVTSLCRMLGSLSPVVMADAQAARRINGICNGLEDLLAEPVNDQSEVRLGDYVGQSIITLTHLKKSVRK